MTDDVPVSHPVLERLSIGTAILGVVILILSYVIPLILVMPIAVGRFFAQTPPQYFRDLMMPATFSKAALFEAITLIVLALIMVTGLVSGIVAYRRSQPRKNRVMLSIFANAGFFAYFCFFSLVELVVSYASTSILFR